MWTDRQTDRQTVEYLGLGQFIKPAIGRVYGVCGTPVSVVESIEIPIEVNGEKVEKTHVQALDGEEHALLLGRQFLRRFGRVEFDWDKEIITLGKVKVTIQETAVGGTPIERARTVRLINTEEVPVKENTNILWKDLPEHFARKIVELFPATNLFHSAHTNVWIPFQEVYFLTVENNLSQNTEFLKFVYELSSGNKILFADIPSSFYSSTIFRIFSELAPKKIFNLKRLCNEIIFPQLHRLPLHNLVLIFNTLIPICSETAGYTWLFSQLVETRFIPCGDGEDTFTLRIPRHVVCPNTTLSTLYQPEEMRIPVPELHSFFALDQPTPVSNVLKRMCVIYDTLPETEVVSRCQITSNLSVGNATSHAITLVSYLNALDKTKLKSINALVKEIPFIPTYHDELFDICKIPPKHFVAPIECYTFQCHHLVTPLYPAASKSMRSFTCLSLIKSPEIDVVFQVLDSLLSNVDFIQQHNIEIQDKLLQTYEYLSKKDSEEQRNIIKGKLADSKWIWHSSNKQFYASNQVILSHSQSLPENTYLVNFPF